MKVSEKARGDEDEDEGDAAEFEDVAEDEACAEEDDAGLEPEVVGGDAGAEDARDADGVGDDDAEEDGPEDVLDVGEGDVVGLGPGVEEVLDELAGVADDEEERDAGEQAEEEWAAPVCRGAQRRGSSRAEEVVSGLA